MNPTNYTLREQAKAVVGAVLAGLTALGTALADGAISPVEWVGIGIAFVATYGTVFGVSNGGTRNQRGEVSTNLVLAIVLGVVLAWAVIQGLKLLF